MEQLLDQLTSAVENASGAIDDKTRRKTIDTLRDLQYMLEPPEETMQRIIHLNLTSASIRVSLDLRIFNLLSESEKPVTLSEIAEKTGGDPILLGRILRHQSSMGIVKEPAQDTFTASKTTKNLSIPEIQSSLCLYNEILGPSFQAIPGFLADRKYQNPTSLAETPFSRAWRTDEPFWKFLDQRPREAAWFNDTMKAQRSSFKNCFEYWNVQQECQDWPVDKPVFLDIGGGAGSQCMALKEKFPAVPGQIILQDLPRPIEETKMPADSGIQKMAYDFFTPQPIKGAKYYYLRAILHDYADDKCIEILRNQVAAMGSDSTLVLDEIVCPNSNVDWFATQTDLAMMTVFSSCERTRTQWETLLTGVGLRIENIVCYTDSFGLSLVFAKKQ